MSYDFYNNKPIVKRIDKKRLIDSLKAIPTPYVLLKVFEKSADIIIEHPTTGEMVLFRAKDY